MVSYKQYTQGSYLFANQSQRQRGRADIRMRILPVFRKMIALPLLTGCLLCRVQQYIIISSIKLAAGMQRKTASHPGISPPQPSQKAQPNPNANPDLDRNSKNANSSFEVRIINPEHERVSGQEQTLQKLLDMNQNYLRDKIKVSDIPRPSKYAHKVPSKTGNSEYNRKYTSLMKHISIGDSTPQRDKTGSALKLPNHKIVEYASTYHQDYTEKKQSDPAHTPQSPQKAHKEYVKSEAPGFIESSYHRDYQSVSSPPVPSAKRAEVKLMGGGKLACDTTYKQCYRLKTIDAAEICQPIVHKDNKIFLQMQNPQKSSYQQSFNSNPKRSKVEPSCKPNQKYCPNPSKLKYKTEYSDVFLSPEVSRKKDFECMTRQQLKQYMMTILKQ